MVHNAEINRGNVLVLPPWQLDFDGFFSSEWHQLIFNPYHIIKKELEEKGWALFSEDSIGDRTVDVIWSLDHTHKKIRGLLDRYPDANYIYYSYEPMAVVPANRYSLLKHGVKENRGCYDHVVEVCYDTHDDPNFTLLQVPFLRDGKCSIAAGTKDRAMDRAKDKLATAIWKYGYSTKKNELYRERERVVDYFETRKDCAFDFFGRNWDDSKYTNYKGAPDDKLSVMSEYKFAFCFENSSEPYNITEKIFDCFIAGCVPIYLGASSIDEFVPEDCYIDYASFSALADLYSFIRDMDDAEYKGYIDRIETLMASGSLVLFTPAYHADKLDEVFRRRPRFQKRLPSKLALRRLCAVDDLFRLLYYVGLFIDKIKRNGLAHAVKSAVGHIRRLSG